MTTNGCEVSFGGDKMFCNLFMVMFAQYVNILRANELYTLKW